MPRGTSPLDAARLQGRLWTPRQMFPALRLWQSAAALETLAGGTGGIETWANLTGRAGLTQATSANQPTLNLAAINGRPALDFSTSSRYRGTAQVSFDSNARFEVVAVFSMRSGATSNARALSFYASGVQDFFGVNSMVVLSRRAGDNVIRTQADSVTLDTAVSLNTPMVFRLSSNGTTFQHFLNGAPGGSATVARTFGAGTFGIGVFSAGDNAPWDGLVAEVIVAVGQDANDAAPRLEGHAAWLYGLQDGLAADHPCRNSPPLIGD
jgi:hypothetical protein